MTESADCGFEGYYCVLYESSYESQLQLRRCDGSDGYRTLTHVTLGDKHGVNLNRADRATDGPFYNLTASADGSSLACTLSAPAVDGGGVVTAAARDRTYAAGSVGLMAYRTKFSVARFDVELSQH